MRERVPTGQMIQVIDLSQSPVGDALDKITVWQWLIHDNHGWMWSHGIIREFFHEKFHKINKTSEEFFQEKEKWKIEAKGSKRHVGRNIMDGQGEIMEKRDPQDMEWDPKQYKIDGNSQMMKISDYLIFLSQNLVYFINENWLK